MIKEIRRAGEVALKVLGVFVILEPIWMLLPFAGFLYGSVLQIESLSRNPATAWLTHFVFPVLTLGFLGPVLGVLGLLLFLAGAVRIYVAKIRRSGLVTGGLYRFVRHPQYIALTLFGAGILLTWGRAISFIACFLMMYVYFWLARNEERRCVALFGDEYERYRERTSFVIPGDRLLRPLGTHLEGLSLPVRVAAGFLLATGLCFGSMALIDAAKRSLRQVPFLTAEIPLELSTEPTGDLRAAEAGGIPFVHEGRVAVVRGPYRNGVAPGFAERALLRLRKSPALREFLAFLAADGNDVAMAFCLPHGVADVPGRPGESDDPERRGPPVDPAGPDRVRLLIFRVTPAAGAGLADLLVDPAKRTIRGACIAPVDLGRPTDQDIVDGPLVRPGPRFPGEERFRHVLSQLAAQPGRTPAPFTAVPGREAEAKLVMVQAPIYRTRRDPAFARSIRDRLAGSATFRERLGVAGAGGEIVPVAFPRPGPNWYREHHGVPQVSVFVMLVRRTSPEGTPKDLFRSGGRELIGAFVVDLDFAIQEGGDSVTAVTPIGPRRDLEERWRFFLSGL